MADRLSVDGAVRRYSTLLRKYEGMFLFDPSVTADWESVQTELARLMERAEARVITSVKWDERRLA